MEKRIIFLGHTVRPIGTAVPHDSQSPAQRIFLLSPANASGIRGNKLLSGRAQFDLALRLPTMGAPLGEIFSFMSSLYFRGKLVYTQRFASPPAGLTGVFVITSSRGLLAPEVIVTVEELRAMSSGSIDNIAFPWSATRICYWNASGRTPKSCYWEASQPQKYVAPLLEIFGKRLVFPCDFVGRGDMSRGGLLLRCSRDSTQLEYVAVANAARRGPRPAK